MSEQSFFKDFKVKNTKEVAEVMSKEPYARNQKHYKSHLVKKSDYREALKKALGK